MPGVPEKMVVFQSSYIILDFVVYVYILLDAGKEFKQKNQRILDRDFFGLLYYNRTVEKSYFYQHANLNKEECGFLELSRKNQYRSSNTP